MIEIKKNYQIELDNIIEHIIKDEKNTNFKPPTLLLHSCCGPCSSYVLEYLSSYFAITVFYYNPNIYPSEEYWYRVNEQQKIIDITNAKYPINMITGKYETERFYELAKGLEDLNEGGERCKRCYELRLTEAAKICKNEGFEYFTTTLSISPHKNSQVLNEIGEKIALEYGIRHLPSDFKKNNGYKRSCEITRENGLYRQDYCGCVYSKREMEDRKKEQKIQEEIKERKIQLRKEMISLAKNLDKDYREESDTEIIKNLLESEEYKKADTIFTYLGRDFEINTSLFIEQALKDNKKISLPVCVSDKKMEAFEIKSKDDLIIGKFDILEPDTTKCPKMEKNNIDLIIVPNCCADKNGNRLGFGRGYYDRYLKDYNGNKVLLVRKKLLLDEIPTSKFDVKIEKIITE